MKDRLTRRTSIAAIVVLGALGGLAAPAQATFPGANGKIAFASARDSGDYAIYSMDADGSAQTQLTANATSDTSPEWSPDGRKLAFSGRFDSNSEIYAMNADGSGQARLTSSGSASDPSWSPDGQKLVFTSARDGNSELYVVSADGSGETRLTNTPGTEESRPAWSPDGEKIAFESREAETLELEVYVMNADGSGRTRLTTSPGIDNLPSWSPDGGKIAFTSARDDDWEIYVMNADGSSQTRLTNRPGDDAQPSFSPDGQKLVYTSFGSGGTAINVMNSDGSAPTSLTPGGRYLAPDWQSLPSADLALSLGASPDAVRSGKQLTYTITVRNLGPNDSQGVVVTDALPPQSRFVSATPTQGGSCETPPAGQTGTLTCQLGLVPNATTRTNQIIVKVIASKRSSITNTASVTAQTPDPNYANNTATIATPVR